MSGESDMEYSSDNDCEYDDYYNLGVADIDVEQIDRKKSDPEFLEYECLNVEAVEKLLNETVEKLSNMIKVTPSLAKVLLLEHKWNISEIAEKYRANASGLLIRARIKPPLSSGTTSIITITSVASSTINSTNINAIVPASNISNSNTPTTTTIANSRNLLLTPSSSTSSTSSTASSTSSSSSSSSTSSSTAALSISSSTTSLISSNYSINMYRSLDSLLCPVCATCQPNDKYFNLACSHSFCKDCWSMHFETQITQGISTAMGCMASKCNVRVPEELVLNLLTKPLIRDKYQQFAFLDYVKSHPELRFCPGPNCQIIVQSKDITPKKANCNSCNSSFCFKCGTDYHAPTDCQVIKRWLTKCADDSETANYISAHTKDCPKCHICIEKNGGCNHMQCFSCKHDFCWMCLGDWKNHGSEYYECSRYKENPNIAHESVHAQAREALKKYLHYYERWENHSKSLQLEQQTLERLRDRINKKVMNCLGTWIDWQHLFNAASLLAKCRYTLQYTYPYAYFMEPGSRKDLFEYQQAQLEAEIENLSWKIERAETTDRGDLENQMDVAEKRRITLLKDFFLTEA